MLHLGLKHFCSLFILFYDLSIGLVGTWTLPRNDYVSFNIACVDRYGLAPNCFTCFWCMCVFVFFFFFFLSFFFDIILKFSIFSHKIYWNLRRSFLHDFLFSFCFSFVCFLFCFVFCFVLFCFVLFVCLFVFCFFCFFHSILWANPFIVVSSVLTKSKGGSDY